MTLFIDISIQDGNSTRQNANHVQKRLKTPMSIYRETVTSQ